MPKKPAVFLDRDGTIIEQVNDIVDSSQVHILSEAPQSIKALKELGYTIVVITNQSVIGKGLVAQEKADAINTKLADDLRAQGATVDGIYMCPHKKEDSCDCRKPAVGLVRDAQKEHDIDLSKSFFIGDRLRDVATGMRAGLTTILVATGGTSKDDELFADAKPDYTARDLQEAVEIITAQ